MKELKSFCPKCDALMTVELEDPLDPHSQFVQVCWRCKFTRLLEND